MNQHREEALERLLDATVYDLGGDKIGKVEDVFLDDESGEPSWITVGTGLFGMKSKFVPLAGATREEDGVLKIPLEKAVVKDSPEVSDSEHLSPEEEDSLYRYYQREASQRSAGEAFRTDPRRSFKQDSSAEDSFQGARFEDEGGRVLSEDSHEKRELLEKESLSSSSEDSSIVLREEELRVSKEREKTGQVRLRKHVVSEEQTVVVPVQREEVEVVREPLEGEAHRAALSELSDSAQSEDVVIDLYEERPTVEKVTVAKERVGLVKESTVSDERFSETMKKEEVEVEEESLREPHSTSERDSLESAGGLREFQDESSHERASERSFRRE